MTPSLRKALALLLITAAFALHGGASTHDSESDDHDGYTGYRLERRGDADSAIYETANTPPGVILAEEPDVYLNASLYVGEISVEVDNITAKVNLDAQVLKLLRISAGVDARIDRVRLLIQNVSAEVELEARLGNVVKMVDDVLTSIDLNPILATLGREVGGIINDTADLVGGGGAGSASQPLSPNSLAKRVEPSQRVEHNVLYSINDYQGRTHTNRVLGQNGTIYDEYLDSDGNEKGRAVVGYYARDMAFTGHNRTILADDDGGDGTHEVREYELEYEYAPFAGIHVTSWVYVDPVGRVIRTQVVADAFGGGTSTISNDDADDGRGDGGRAKLV